jgi:hypothetical protein
MSNLSQNEMSNNLTSDEEQCSNAEHQNHYVGDVTSPNGADPENLERPSITQDATPTNTDLYILLSQLRSELSRIYDMVAKLNEDNATRQTEDNSSDSGYDSYSDDDYGQDSYSDSEHDGDKQSEDNEYSDAYSEDENRYAAAKPKSRGRFPIAL